MDVQVFGMVYLYNRKHYRIELYHIRDFPSIHEVHTEPKVYCNY